DLSVPPTTPSPPPIPPPTIIDLQTRRPNEKEPASTSDLIAKLRAFVKIQAHEREHATIPTDFHAELRSYCRENRWRDVLNLTASLIIENREQRNWLTSFEMLFCVAAAKQLTVTGNHPGRDTLHNLCLGIIAALTLDDRGESYYYADRERTCSA